LKNASTLGYFNSAQAIADYAAIIIHIKKTLQAKDSPVIVIGGSYGGSRWLRTIFSKNTTTINMEEYFDLFTIFYHHHHYLTP